MSYPNVGGYNPNYPNGQQGAYGASAPGGYANYQGGPQGGYAPGQPGGYSGASHHAGGPPQVNPDIQRWFSTVDRDHSGKISAKELQAALVNGQGRNFSDQACNLMIGMFDHDKSGTIDVQEFQQLYNYINQWIATFRTYDRDNSGHIEEAELSQAFQQMGFRFSQEFIKFLVSKSDLQNHAKITVDQFIVLSVQIQRFTDIKERQTEPYFLGTDSYFVKSKRKRKGDLLNDVGIKEELDEEKEEIDNGRYKIGSSHQTEESQNESGQLKAELDLVILENVQLIRENKLLQEANRSLERQNALLKEDIQRLRRERENAIDLSSWLTSAKEMAENLSEQMKRCAISRRDVQAPTRNRLWDDMESDTPFANGNKPVKQERVDDEEYHTPLLNFDQVDYPPKEESMNRSTNRPMTDSSEPEAPLDDIGREQLLHPELVDGVCELCPGSRIYVSLSAMDNIMNKRTHSSVARSCLEAIFKTTYLLSCSVQGNVAKGPYGKPEFQRPSLFKPAVDSILRFARYYAERNGWKIEEVTTIKKQMNTRLSELRNVAKSKHQSQPANPGQSASQNQKSEPTTQADNL